MPRESASGEAVATDMLKFTERLELMERHVHIEVQQRTGRQWRNEGRDSVREEQKNK